MASTPASRPLKLEHLPPEVLHSIFFHVQAKQMLQTLTLICKRFNKLISDELFWKTRLLTAMPYIQLCDSVVSQNTFSWKTLCFSIENEVNRWNPLLFSRIYSPGHTASRIPCAEYLLQNAHFGCVDAVHLMNSGTRLVSGARDRSICFWDVTNMDNAEEKKIVKDNAHQGWVWAFSDCHDKLYSGGWDCKLHCWDMNTSDIQNIRTWKCDSPILGVLSSPTTLITSCFDHSVNVIDARASNEHAIVKMKYHNGAVVGLAGDTDSHYVYSCAEDKQIFCVDRRMWQPIKHIKCARQLFSLSLAHEQLWAGDSGGRLHLIDPQQLKLVKSFQLTNGFKVRHVLHSLGYVMCVSADKTIRICSPGKQIKLIASIGPFNDEATKVSYAGGKLVTGFSDGSVGLWTGNN